MTYAELRDHLAAKHRLTKKTTQELMVELFLKISMEASRGRVHIPGFGVFRPSSRKARRISHPITKEPLQLPVSFGVRFTPAKTLKRWARIAVKTRAARQRQINALAAKLRNEMNAAVESGK